MYKSDSKKPIFKSYCKNVTQHHDFLFKLFSRYNSEERGSRNENDRLLRHVLLHEEARDDHGVSRRQHVLLLRQHVQREGGRSLKPLLVVIDIILLRNPIFSQKLSCSKVKRSQKKLIPSWEVVGSFEILTDNFFSCNTSQCGSSTIMINNSLAFLK